MLAPTDCKDSNLSRYSGSIPYICLTHALFAGQIAAETPILAAKAGKNWRIAAGKPLFATISRTGRLCEHKRLKLRRLNINYKNHKNYENFFIH